MKFLMLSCVVLIAVISDAHARPAAQSSSSLGLIRERLNHVLRDPASAQIQITRTLPSKVCGRFNAKNAYGGYVGFKPFSYVRGSGELHYAGMIVHQDGTVEDLDSVMNRKTSGLVDIQRMSTEGNSILNRNSEAAQGCS
jgi:hypothetical protein